MSGEKCECLSRARLCDYHLGLEKRVEDAERMRWHLEKRGEEIARERNEFAETADKLEALLAESEKRVEELEALANKSQMLAAEAGVECESMRAEHKELKASEAMLAGDCESFQERIAQLEAELMQCRKVTGDEGEAENTLAAVKALREDHDQLEAERDKLRMTLDVAHDQIAQLETDASYYDTQALKRLAERNTQLEADIAQAELREIGLSAGLLSRQHAERQGHLTATEVNHYEQRIAVLEALKSELEQQARIHAQEARTANATIAEIYQLCTDRTGEPGNWHGAEPVRQMKERLEARNAELEQEVARLSSYRSRVENDI